MFYLRLFMLKLLSGLFHIHAWLNIVHDWRNSQETSMIGYGKQNCMVLQNSLGLVDFALIFGIPTSQHPRGTG